MRILIVSNLYPPHYIGGYELGCQQVVEALRQQGHQVKVLTSSYGVKEPAVEGETYRWLAAEPFWLGQLPSNTPRDIIKKERVNQSAFHRLCREFKPEAVYFWNMAHISISLAFIARQQEIPVFYYISDRWLSQWDTDSWIAWCRKTPSSALKRAAKKLALSALSAAGLNTMHGLLDLSRVQFTSLFMKEQTVQAGVPVADSQVIHWGVDVDQYAGGEVAGTPPTRLLFVGQARKHKGIHTAVEAFAHLKSRNPDLPLTLTIAGGSSALEEETQLREQIVCLGLEKEVTLTGMLPRSKIIPYYQTHDVLIFPSIFDEPFSITLLEGLSSGLAVVGTTKGGSREILQEGENALTFPAGDAEACADQLQRLIEDPELYRKIRRNGRKTVVNQFQFKMMMDKISTALQTVQASHDQVSKEPVKSLAL